jgi:hypothetical protein
VGLSDVTASLDGAQLSSTVSVYDDAADRSVSQLDQARAEAVAPSAHH